MNQPQNEKAGQESPCYIELMRLGEQSITGDKLLDVLRKQSQMKVMIRDLIIDKELSSIRLDPQEEEGLLREFREKRQLDSEESYRDYLNLSHLDDRLLREMVSKPIKVIRYREARWGQRVKSLYLENKERYDIIIYRRLQSPNHALMQEVFFRLKEEEESWENMAHALNPGNETADPRIGPKCANEIEPMLMAALRQAGVGKIIRPLGFNGQTVVAELEKVQASTFNDELRQRILREKFEEWITKTCRKMLSMVTYTT